MQRLTRNKRQGSPSLKRLTLPSLLLYEGYAVLHGYFTRYFSFCFFLSFSRSLSVHL